MKASEEKGEKINTEDTEEKAEKNLRKTESTVDS